MEIYITDGIIYRVTGMGSLDGFPAPIADEIARANGYHYAEQFVKAHTGKAYRLGRDWKIKAERVPPRTP